MGSGKCGDKDKSFDTFFYTTSSYLKMLKEWEASFLAFFDTTAASKGGIKVFF